MMLETDKVPISCPQCGEDSSWQVGYLRQQPMLACPLCGNEVTGQMHQALGNIGEAGKGA